MHTPSTRTLRQRKRAFCALRSPDDLAEWPGTRYFLGPVERVQGCQCLW